MLRATTLGALAAVALAEATRSSASNCTWQKDMDYQPTSSSGTFHATTQEECCALCWQHPTCRAGTFQPSSSKCFLKGGLITPVPKPGANLVGCLARPNPSPPPPFDCSKPGADCAGRLGATHWNPCYFINPQLPVLIDGAQSLASMGSRVIKVAVFNPRGNYPFNSPDWPEDSAFTDLRSMLQHKYYRMLWDMSDFDTFVLIAYSTVGGPAGGDISYYAHGITDAQVEEETKQLREAASWLIATYPQKTFVIENWEGDWASRAGGYDANKPATNLSLMSMRRWLAARQAGVTQARAARDEAVALGGDERTTQGNVFFSAEVNLVQKTRTTVGSTQYPRGFPNMVNEVIPYVQLDMVSYSSYDSQESPSDFPACLDFIAAHHNRTAASPPGHAAYFIAEYGMAENIASNQTVVATVENVVSTALSWGASFVLFWETFDNECTGGVGCSAGRCHDAAHPVSDPKRLHGFWLTRPDGSHSWPYTFLKRAISEGTHRGAGAWP